MARRERSNSGTETDATTAPGRGAAEIRTGRAGARPAETELGVFGRRVVEEALALDSVEPLELRIAERTPGALRHTLRRAARRRDLDVELTHDRGVSALSDAPRHDQGVALRLRLRSVTDVEAFVASRTGRAARAPTRLLALDGLTNSQNIGMIVRTARATGLDGLLWPRRGVPWVNGLVVKASAGEVLRAPIVRCHTLFEGLATLQGAGFACVGLDARAKARLATWRPPHRLVFVVGNETRGLGDDVASLLDERVSIEMAEGVESLNVAVAASLVCYRLFEHARRDA
jgi:23S rRNA (guanosine2251-2'-O)-methyltransferase